ncbi:ribonuclease hi [Plakobranchus ocellatus]|uniref:Ribonuclease hi n=1 Tax=Plakobranchus ocellatus TaxID=259542 RepID=A0AAV3XUD4_9GAST|nr:ribonuclease hi [Plakobranchus ocellatus]
MSTSTVVSIEAKIIRFARQWLKVPPGLTNVTMYCRKPNLILPAEVRVQEQKSCTNDNAQRFRGPSSEIHSAPMRIGRKWKVDDAVNPIRIRGNDNVDKLAKAALNRASSPGKLICWSDLKPKVNVYIYTIWQENWDAYGANKLYEVLPNLGQDQRKRGEGAGRKRETAMCRLRVGHIWLIHS